MAWGIDVRGLPVVAVCDFETEARKEETAGNMTPAIREGLVRTVSALAAAMPGAEKIVIESFGHLNDDGSTGNGHISVRGLTRGDPEPERKQS